MIKPSPIAPSHDRGDRGTTDAILGSDLFVRDTASSVSLADSVDLFAGQAHKVIPLSASGAEVFSSSVPLSGRRTSFCNHVGHVVCLRSEKEMLGVTAESNVAPMKDVQSIWNGAVSHFPSDTVSASRQALAVLPEADLAVTVIANGASPKHAAVVVSLSLSPEARSGGGVQCCHLARLRAVRAAGARNRDGDRERGAAVSAQQRGTILSHRLSPSGGVTTLADLTIGAGFRRVNYTTYSEGSRV